MHSSFRSIVFLVGLVFVVVAAVFLTSNSPKPISGTPIIKLGGQEVTVIIADTPEERTQGLSGRQSLAEGEGMLFVFPEDGRHSIWMKDMLFSIDIVWVSPDGVVVDIAAGVSPDTYPAAFSPRSEARYVLELPAGFTERYTIVVGNRVEF